MPNSKWYPYAKCEECGVAVGRACRTDDDEISEVVCRGRGPRDVRAGRPHSAKWDDVGLGTKPDIDIAVEHDVSDSAVRRQRKARGIPAFRQPRDRPLPQWGRQPLGKMADRELGRRLGVSGNAVSRARRQMGIPPHGRKAVQ